MTTKTCLSTLLGSFIFIFGTFILQCICGKFGDFCFTNSSFLISLLWIVLCYVPLGYFLHRESKLFSEVGSEVGFHSILMMTFYIIVCAGTYYAPYPRTQGDALFNSLVWMLPCELVCYLIINIDMGFHPDNWEV